jgi:anti-sigma factor RsiW
MAAEHTAPIGEDDLQALVDGVLGAARKAAVERYLADCPDEAARVRAFIAQRDALRAALAFKALEPIPARLRVANLRAGRRRVALQWWRMGAAAAVLVMIGSGLGWTLRGSLGPEPTATAAAIEPTLMHRQLAQLPAPRMLALARDTEIGAWLLPRLGEALAPPDLADFGFALERALVVPGSDGPAAMLLYVDPDGMALSVWRRPTRDPVPRQLRCVDEPGGLLTYSWSDGARLYAVTAAMPRDRLRPIAQHVEREMRAPPPPAGLMAGLARRPCDHALG